MIPGQLFANVSYIDAILFLTIIGAWFVIVKIQRQKERKIEEAEKKTAALKRYQAELYEHLESKFETLKKVLFDKTKDLNKRIDELSRSIDVGRERNVAMMKEINSKIEPLKASFRENFVKVHKSHDRLRKKLQETEQEMEKIADDMNTFFQELQKMKDYVRERTIDLEL